MKQYLIFAFLIINIFSIQAQTNEAATTTITAQPTIMVIPFARQGQNLRQVYESDEITRIAITKAKEAFDKRGVNTIDLRAKLKQTNNNAALQEDQVADIKDDVISASGADMYVEIEASKNYSSTGNSVNLILTAYDAFSGESLANKTANSAKVYTENYEKLTEKAIEQEIDNLLNTMQEKFNDMRINVRTITLSVGIDMDSDLTMDTEINSDGDYISDIIEDWVKDNAYKSQYHLQGITSNKITFDLIKIPLFDEKGQNYKVNSFSREFRRFMSSNSIQVTPTLQGNNISVTIKGSK